MNKNGLKLILFHIFPKRYHEYEERISWFANTDAMLINKTIRRALKAAGRLNQAIDISWLIHYSGGFNKKKPCDLEL